ncbi:MAG: penicillin-binding protein 1C [Bacteroidia bacterium]|nr:penicillin-binding protein 1C [Bacteroidia bacterium]
MKIVLKRLFIAILFCIFSFCLLDSTFPFEPSPAWSQIVYDRKGRVLNCYLSKDDKWRMRCAPSQTDALLLQTVLLKEDRYFRYHPGFNPLAIARAAFNNLVKKQRSSGASTITMQVVRLLEPRPRTFGSKIIELFRAIQLERRFSKNQILELYLSLAPYGGNVEGVTSASYIYFGKAPAMLSPAEAVTLTIIPNRPSSLRPGRENQLLLRERNRWLKILYHEGAIRAGDLEEALAEPLEMQRKDLPFLAPHLARRLCAGNSSPEIYSSLDADMQMKVQQLCYNHLQRLKASGIHNGAILVIDNLKHEVLAYAGSQDYNDFPGSGQVDGIRAIRSPGSTLKPLVYAMAIDEGLATPGRMLQDVPVSYEGYSPENFDLRYHGLVSMEDALSASLNIPAVQLLRQLGVPAFRDRLLLAGCRSFRQQRQLGLSTILGGCGTTLEELCGLYSALANEGTYVPFRYTRNPADSSLKKKLVSPAAAYLISEMLTRMNRPELPNLFENSLHIPKVAWKTGTSYGRRDAWSIGYNRQYTVGVWVGNFDGRGVPELTGAEMATPLLFQVFNSIDQRANGNWYRPTRALDLRYVCPQSGLVPGEHCTEKVIDYFLPGISSMKTCDHLREFCCDERESMSYCTACLPQQGYKKIICENPAPEIMKYYREQGIPVKTPPPHNPSCRRLFEGERPVILSLQDGQEYLMEKDEDRQLELSCAVAAEVGEVSWFINDVFYKTLKADEKTFFKPQAGAVKISCSDDKGRNRDIRILVTFY